MCRVLLLMAVLAAVADVAAQTNVAESAQPNYYSQTEGIRLSDIVKRAFETNGEIRIARLEAEKAKARLTQAGLRRNPTLDVEQGFGSLVGSSGDSEFTAGVSVPLEVFGQRDRRIDFAKADITLKEAEMTARQRHLAARIILDYVEALTALRELKVVEELIALDLETAKVVQIRVNEGESAPLELSLMQAEIERIRGHRQIIEGRLQAAITKLKLHAGIPYDQPLKLREDVSNASVPSLPATVEAGFALGLKNRPEIRTAELEEQLANAGLQLVRSTGKPHLSAFSRFTQGRSTIDLPDGPYPQETNRLLSFGISIGLPVFDRNQGAKAEAEIAIRQARERRAFAEQVVKNEIVVAYQQVESAKRALSTLETAVLPRSRENVETIRKVYEIGEIKITELLTEQRRLLDINRELTESLTKRYKAETDLFIALGLTFEN